MKKSLITLSLIIAFTMLKAQAHLPAKVKLELTDKQIVNLASQLDSLYMTIQSSDIPAKFANHRINMAQIALFPLFEQVRKQMVQDSVKPTKTPKK